MCKSVIGKLFYFRRLESTTKVKKVRERDREEARASEREMAQPSKEPCKKEACDIQACLSKNNFLPQRLLIPQFDFRGLIIHRDCQ